jgi:hypothetical protein
VHRTLQTAAQRSQVVMPNWMRKNLRQVRADPERQVREQQGETRNGGRRTAQFQEEAQTRPPGMVLRSLRGFLQGVHRTGHNPEHQH